ncbi:uncharacterized protein LOC130725163 [Lotus japonicus]|uniref:uncharacterized protein LOC130725163 n=1 Tax=Lotus japonicus TaxID=34305 RepID=UPI00258BA11D|nr:uncharacterized protein LOC130725163 [Lotus japonicus]
MRILSWNCRGLGNKPTFRVLQRLIHSEGPDVVFVTETRLHEAEMLRHCGIGGLSNLFPVLCARGGRGGGLCLLWGTDVKGKVINASLNHILLTLAVYGFPEVQNKHRTWELIRRLKPSDLAPLFCIGDFNDILSPANKLGGDIPEMRHLQLVNQACVDCDLHDVGFLGARFTWTNNRGRQNSIQEHLDYALVNQEWAAMWPVMQVSHIIKHRSDHNPILLSFLTRKGHRELRRTHLFIFEELWLQEGDECAKIVAETWCRSRTDFT